MNHYVLSFTSVPISIISSLVFAGQMWFVVANLLMTQLGDHIGHDVVLLIAFCLESVGVLFECIATNIYVFAIGFFLVRCAFVDGTAMSYTAFVLPHQNAVKYIANFYSAAAVLYLISPLFAALLSHYFGYRVVFVFNFIALAIGTCVAALFVFGSQAKLQQRQKEWSASQKKSDGGQKTSNMIVVWL